MNGPLLPFPSFSLHVLPEWFLIVALFLPRLALFAAWFKGNLMPFHLDFVAAPVLAILLPRILVLALIYLDQGIDGWFLVHAVMGLFVIMGFHRPKAEPMDRGVVYIPRRRPGLPDWRL